MKSPNGYSTTQVTVDTASIPQCIRPFLLAPIVDAVAEYMKRPGVEEKYQAWLAAKNAADAAEQGGSP